MLSSSQAYSKAVGGPVLRNHSHPMTSITTHLLPNETNSKTPSQRYKTELCRSYHETGFCKYGEKCQFAHGYDEIRSLNRHPKYKTVLCRTYHCTGYCKSFWILSSSKKKEILFDSFRSIRSSLSFSA